MNWLRFSAPSLPGPQIGGSDLHHNPFPEPHVIFY